VDDAPDDRHPPLWRWQHVIAAIVALATVGLVVVGVASIRGFRPDDGHNPPASGDRTTASGSGGGTSTSGRATASTRPPRTGLGLGTDIPPISQAPCRTPRFADGSAWELAAVDVHGETFEGSYFCNLLAGGVGQLEFQLSKRYRSFTVTIGFGDDSPSQTHTVKFEVISDGNVYLAPPTVLRFGETRALDCVVKDTARLTLRITELSRPGGSEAASKVTWASPTVA
jgi:hypothetical protein